MQRLRPRGRTAIRAKLTDNRGNVHVHDEGPAERASAPIAPSDAHAACLAASTRCKRSHGPAVRRHGRNKRSAHSKGSAFRAQGPVDRLVARRDDASEVIELIKRR